MVRSEIERRWDEERSKGRERLPEGLTYSSEADYEDAAFAAGERVSAGASHG